MQRIQEILMEVPVKSVEYISKRIFRPQECKKVSFWKIPSHNDLVCTIGSLDSHAWLSCAEVLKSSGLPGYVSNQDACFGLPIVGKEL